MAFEFKRLSDAMGDIETVSASDLGENAKVPVYDDGDLKAVPKSEIGGSAKGMVITNIEEYTEGYSGDAPLSYDEIAACLLSGGTVWVYSPDRPLEDAAGQPVPWTGHEVIAFSFQQANDRSALAIWFFDAAAGAITNVVLVNGSYKAISSDDDGGSVA